MDNAKLYKPQKMKYFLVIDQGTSSTRAILFDENFAVVNVSQTEFKQFFPKDGCVEHDPEEIWETVLETSKNAKFISCFAESFTVSPVEAGKSEYLGDTCTISFATFFL